MIAKPSRDGLYHLADALSEDVINMSEGELLAEVDEDLAIGELLPANSTRSSYRPQRRLMRR